MPKVALMGLAFKPNIDDLRESPAVYIVNKVLAAKQDCDYLIVEPNIGGHPVFELTNYKEAVEQADIFVLLVAHKEFRGLDLKGKAVVDFCGVV